MYIEENPTLTINELKIKELKEKTKNVKIVAATKYISEDAMRALYNAGIDNFGENRVEPFVRKHNNLKDLNATWHFIGHLQRNKAKMIINDIDYLHSLDSLDLAKIINDKREKPLNCFIELKLLEDSNKDGVLLSDLDFFIKTIRENYPKCNIVGFMAMTEPEMTNIEKKELFTRVVELGHIYNLHEFSLGMSEDYKEAIESGTTYIRLGRILYNM